MLDRIALVALVFLVCTLGSCGGNTPASDPGPLIDNTRWVPTSDGDELLGPPPPDAECVLEPIDCDEEYPWPEGECVTFAVDSTCIASFVPECIQSMTVLTVETRRPDNRLTLCNWITLAQPSLRAIRAGDRVEVRASHAELTAPVTAEARMIFVIGDEIALGYSTLIPSDPEFPTAVWTATKDYPAGTPLLWHVDNHGANQYLLIEVNVL